VREGNHLEVPGVDGRIILKQIFEKWDWGLDWVELAEDRDSWLAVMYAVINVHLL
jgi:hypothetical protein